MKIKEAVKKDSQYEQEQEILLKEIHELESKVMRINGMRGKLDNEASKIYDKINDLKKIKEQAHYARLDIGPINEKQLSFRVQTIGTDSKHLLSNKWLGVTLQFDSFEDIKKFDLFITPHRKTPINYKLTLTKLN